MILEGEKRASVRKEYHSPPSAAAVAKTVGEIVAFQSLIFVIFEC